ncbi:hypothetical protein GCQ56_14040 [Marinifilum sp. N1E240]|uniref:hypothetical protein n=1 Tax=Marinifilum sp. N1E240 TaxID=2608082 RepID=UPI00128D5262|nr:hypothetical protein [Marinifilum sp. N1E240]MPQ48123.1 hypothetical protein [Marinifilum sp. N1E240]
MSEKTDKIELRSEKVRNIIGQIPSHIIRNGITILFVVVIILLTGSYFFRYPDTVKGTAYLYSDSLGSSLAKVYIPYHFINKIEKKQKLNIIIEGYSANEFGQLKGEIFEINPTPIVLNNVNCFIVNVILVNGMKSNQNKIIPFYQNLKGDAKITVGEQRLLEKFLPSITLSL